MTLPLRVYILDNGTCSSNEDFHPNRWVYQTEAVRCLSRALSTSPSPSTNAVAAVGCAPRPRLIAPPGTCDALMTALREAEVPQEGVCQMGAALRLALLTARQATSLSVVAFVGSQATLSETEARQVAAQFAAAKAQLDIVVLGETDASFPDAALQVLVQSANTAAAAADTSVDASAPQQIARLVRFSAPDVAERDSMPLWQQLEGLLEQLEAPGTAKAMEEGEEEAVDMVLDTPNQVPSSSSTSSRLPPRPPSVLSQGAGTSRRAASHAGLAAAAAGLGISPPPALVIKGRNSRPASCRCESLDSLQHLSGDGFLRSWLPSYSNLARIVPAVNGQGGESSKYCFLSVCQMQTPKWHTLLTLRAGRVVPQQPGRPQQTSSCPSSPKKGSAASRQAPSFPASTSSSVAATGQPEEEEPAVASGEARAPGKPPCVGAPAPATASLTCAGLLRSDDDTAPCTPSASEETCTSASAGAQPVVSAGSGTQADEGYDARCVENLLSHFLGLPPVMPPPSSSSKGENSGLTAGQSWAARRPQQQRSQRVTADPRPGTLKLMASTHDSCMVKLVWSEHKQESQYKSLFEATERARRGTLARPSRRGLSEDEDSDDEDSEDEDGSDTEDEGAGQAPSTSASASRAGRWEVELVLSPTRTAFAAVPGSSGKVLEVCCPASVRKGAGGAMLDAGGQPRFLFWLQQGYTSKAGLSASAALAASRHEDAAVGSNAAAAAAQDMQALLECPPDWSEQAPELDDPEDGCGSGAGKLGVPRRRHAGRRLMGQPMQVGPLPRSLIEDLMKSTGRQLLPDGRIVMATPNPASTSEDEVWGSSARPAAQMMHEAERRWQQEQWQRQRRQRQQAAAAAGQQVQQERETDVVNQVVDCVDDAHDQLRHLRRLRVSDSATGSAAGRHTGTSAAHAGQTAGGTSMESSSGSAEQKGCMLPSHPLYDLDDFISPPAPPAAPTRTCTSVSGCEGKPAAATAQDVVLPMFFPPAAAAGQGGGVGGLTTDPAAQNDSDSLLFELD